MILILLSLYLTYAGLASFALAMDKHHAQAFEHKAGIARKRWLRLSGGILLLMALCAWNAAIGLAMGLVSWLLWVLPVVGIIVAFGLSYQPRLVAYGACRIQPK